MDVRFLGVHNLESDVTRLASILIDGLLVLDAGSLVSELSISDQQLIEAILLTHRHYDHVRDIPAIAINTVNSGTIKLFASSNVLEAVGDHMLNGVLYPKFQERPSEAEPGIRFCPIEAGRAFDVAQYEVLPVTMKHSAPTLGFQITSAKGKRLFYSGDTGPGIGDSWGLIRPDLLIIESTLPNRMVTEAIASTHLTPALLEEELRWFLRINRYLPRVLIVHMHPMYEAEIRGEVKSVSENLQANVSLANEGLVVSI